MIGRASTEMRVRSGGISLPSGLWTSVRIALPCLPTMTPTDETPTVAIDIDNVWLMRNDRPILRDVSWNVRAGEQAAILGPNGSGKSTLARILLGYLWATRGTVRVAGRVFGETNLNDLRQVVRLVQPTLPFEIDPAMSVREVVFTGFQGTLAVYSAMSDEQATRVDAVSDRFGLHRLAGGAYGHLSTGEKLRTQLARAMIVKPKVLILDEPTAGLDIRGREELLELLDDMGSEPHAPAMVMVTHHTEELPRRTSNVLLLDNGVASATGTPEAVLTGERLSQVYGCPVEVHVAERRYHLHAKSRFV